MSNLKYKLEALLFSSARSMTVEELTSLTKSTPEEVREKLEELKRDYGQRDSSITLIDEGNSFKLNIKSEHIPVIQQIITEPELSKTLMETLATIAFKYPIKQSDLIKVRTNKAYDHLKQLEGMGYISRQKYGRTNLIKLTPKFFEYFDLPPEKLKQKFESFEGIAKAIKEKEEEIKKIKEEMKKTAQEAGKKKAIEVDLIDEQGHKQKLEVYTETQKEIEEQEAKKIEPYADKFGKFEIVDVSETKVSELEKEETGKQEEIKPIEGIEEQAEITEETEKEAIEEAKEIVEEEIKEKEIEEESEEDEVDREIERMLHPTEEIETTERETGKEETTEEEQKKKK